MPVHTFDPANVIVSIGGTPISGLADGTFVMVSRDEDAFSKVSGADGEVSRAKSNNRSGSLTLTLLQTSMSNDILSAIAALDEISNTGVVPVFVKEMGATKPLTTLFACEGWIKKMPDASYGKEIENREWVFDLATVNMFEGGNPYAS